MQNISEIEDLVKLISKLPGLGPKSAKRIVLKLINNRDELIKPMAKALVEVYKNISRCKICGSLKPTSIECNYHDCKIVERALDNNIDINVALANKSPIGVDSKEDYLAIKKIMKYK